VTVDGLCDEQLLRERFGFSGFRPGQREVLEALTRQRAALGVFPTGAGKSLCYQLPALKLDGVTLVICPLIALMKDQIDFLRGRGIAACRLDSTQTAEEAQEVVSGLQAGAVKLLYVAPERFNNERFLQLIGRLKIALFAVDEAHCISEWGHNFRPDYLKVAEIGRRVKAERVLGLTATATPEVVDDICAAFDIPRACAVVTGFYRPNLTLLTTPVQSQNRDDRLRERLAQRPPGPTIVYTTLQKTAERVASLLGETGRAARAYHAGLENEERTAVQEWWMGAEAGIVVATIAFGMGIDKAGVRYVYHYNLPKSLESYSQEIGRAGRDGAPATVELFACADDVPTLENFAFGDTPTESALTALLEEVVGARSAGAEFYLNLSDLSFRHDIRPLVLRTALTYLELLGVLRHGTPFYAAYELKPALPPEQIAAKFQGERSQLVTDLFNQAKKGRLWYRLNPELAAAALDQPRERIVRALEYIQKEGWAELRPSEVRHRYRRLRPREDLPALVAELATRFRSREQKEIARLRQVLDLVVHDGCQVNALVGHFGEKRTEPCQHCSFCLLGRQALPEALALPTLPGSLDVSALGALRRDHAAALGHARQVARFLCGLSSPALSRLRLTRHQLFGALEEHRFADVLRWCADGCGPDLPAV
jgi:ATP-dependent DNA helicase RecQ